MREPLRRLADPGPPSWITAAVRVVLAAVFIPNGLDKFVNYDANVELFGHWGFGAAAGGAVILVGLVEFACGLMLLIGALPRLAALGLVGDMIGAAATAGRVDGGQQIWVPLLLIALLAVVVRRGGGRWTLLPRRAIVSPP